MTASRYKMLLFLPAPTMTSSSIAAVVSIVSVKIGVDDSMSIAAEALTHWDCIRQVYSSPNYADVSKSCYDSYRNDVTQPGQFCTASSDLAFCLAIGTVSVNECADNDVQWWTCERASRRASFEGFCP